MASWVSHVTYAVGLVVLGASASRADGAARVSALMSTASPITVSAALPSAELDFADVLVESGLSGSAPMVGEARFVSSAERAEAAALLEAERDFDAVLGELGLSGSAPLVGMERSRPDDGCEGCARTCGQVSAGAGSEPLGRR
jgi:hypothetical protein